MNSLNEVKTCGFSSCGRPHSALGYCAGHYRQLREGRELTPLRFRRKKGQVDPCEGPECANPAYTEHYCPTHYSQMHTTGRVWVIKSKSFRGVTVCDVQGCPEDHRSMGKCSVHYEAWLNSGGHLPDSVPLTCTVVGCPRSIRYETTLMCSSHSTTSKRYGLTSIQLSQAFAKGCALCGSADNLCLDHDHSCCKTHHNRTCGFCLRGVLCQKHNKALGLIGDDLESALKVVEYLKGVLNFY